MMEAPVSAFEPISPASESVTTCHTAQFSTRTLHPSIVAITALGELDAANAQDFIAYALRHATGAQRLVLDLSGVEFFGAAAFSALHTLNVRCARDGTDWAVVPSTAVRRLLQICDPDATLPVTGSIETASATVAGEPRPLLQLVPEPS